MTLGSIIYIVLTALMGIITAFVFLWERKYDYAFTPFRKSKICIFIFSIMFIIAITVILALW